MRPNPSRCFRSHQAGFALLSTLFALVIVAILAAGQIEAQALQRKIVTGRLQGDVLSLIKKAANDYTMDAYAQLQLDQPATHEGLTLAPGSTNGQSMAPTIANLIAMKYLPPGTSATAQINDGTYRVRLEKIPAGCIGVACNVTGMVYIDQPIRQPGTTEMAGVQVGSLMDTAGGDVLVALNTNPASMMAVNGAPLTNPVLGTPSGVVGARIGFGSIGFGRFLVLNDPRDPNFQGNLTIAQNFNVGGTSTFTGDVNVNNCVRLQQDGRGGFNCLDPTDLPSGYSGGVRAIDVVSSGSVLASDAPASFTGNNTNFAQLVAGGGGVEAMVKTSGQVAGDRLAPTGAYTPGTACSTPNAISGSNAAFSGLVICAGGIWTPLATVAVVGAACPMAGQGAMDNQGRQLFCFNGTWNFLSDFLPPATVGAVCSVPGAIGYTVPTPGAGSAALVCRANPSGGPARWFRLQDVTSSLVFVTAYEVVHGSVIAKPTCTAAAGQTPVPIPLLVPKVESSDDGGFNRFVIDSAGSWTVQLTSGHGNALAANPSASALLQIYCYYP
ncbi:hypothetical protein SRS16P2_00522 (plasmid) [Variovorax sp. SRS16]|uniref:hypothetical protein n=1 Tax=Variovorax sp. SRS16 TaxID=282217 RepID=UPI001317600C|nr:hypothetical protein [Variovorax sp. SRS16]VTU46175.1 hypothetical protein SRS16P2_00522 [Variovorax sp. SRS16]